MDAKEITDLKAAAYDSICMMEFHQKRLREINQKLSDLLAPKKTEE